MSKIETIRSNITKHYEKKKEEYQKRKSRDNRYKWSKYYQDSKWKSLRELKISHQPICEVCEAEGRAVPAEHIHHIRRFSSGVDEFEKYKLLLDYNNLMSLCLSHHKMAHEIMNNENKDMVTIGEIVKYDEKLRQAYLGSPQEARNK